MALTKIYRIEIQGGQEALNQITKVNNEIDRKKKVIADAQKEKLVNKDDLDQLAKLNAIIVQEQADIKQLSAEKKLLTKEYAASIEAQAKKIQQDEKEAASVQHLEGSYNSLIAQQRELRKGVQASAPGGSVVFQGSTLGFDVAIEKLKELSFAEQTFRRQFQQDGTLVGEYASGIGNAFKRLGIDDIIERQVNGGKQAIEGLELQTKELVVAYRQAEEAGSANMAELEQKIHANVVETENLRKSVQNAEAQLKGMGGVGNQITESIGSGFKKMANQVAEFALTFYGFQAAFSFIDGAIEKFDQAEKGALRLEAVVKNLGKESDLAPINSNLEQLKEKFAYLSKVDLTAATQRLVTYGKLSADQINTITNLAVNLAAQQGKTVEETTQSIIKAIGGGRAQFLKEYGINLADAKTESEKFALVVDGLTQKVSGQAQVFADSASGKVQAYREKLNQLQIDIGSKLLPVLGQLLKFLSPVVALFAALPFGPILAGLALLTTAYFGYNVALTITRFNQGLLNKETFTYQLLQKTTTAINFLATLAVRAWSIAVGLATKEFVLFNGALRISPLGLILTGLTLLVTAFTVMGSKVGIVTEAMRKQALQQKILSEIHQKANEQIADEISKIDILYRTATNLNASYESRKMAIEGLIEQNPRFQAGLDGEVISLEKLRQAYDDVTRGIRLKADADAAASVTSEQKKNVLEVSTLKFKLDQAASQPSQSGRFKIDNLTSKEQSLLFTDQILKSTTGRQGGGDDFTFSAEDYPKLKKIIDQVVKAREDTYQSYLDATATTNEKLKTFEEEQKAKNQQTSRARAENEKLSVKELTDLIAGIDEQRDVLKEGDPKLKELELLRDSYQKRLDALNGKDTKVKAAKGSKLSVEESDAFKQIDAAKDIVKAALEKAKLEQTEFNGEIIDNEKKYLQDLLLIDNQAIDAKLALLKGKKGPAEVKLSKELELQEITNTKTTNQKLFDIESKKVEDEFNLQVKHEQRIRDYKLTAPGLSETAKLNIEDDFNNKLYDLTIKKNSTLSGLENQYRLKSVDNEQKRVEAIEAIVLALSGIRQKSTKAELDDQITSLEDQAAIKLNKLKEDIARETIAILSNDKISEKEKANQLTTLEQSGVKSALEQEIEKLKSLLPVYERLLQGKYITEKQYSDLTTQLKTQEAALIKAGNDKEISSFALFKKALLEIRDTFKEAVLGIKSYEDSAKGQLEKMGDATKQAESTIKSAINAAFQGYFENQKARVDQEKQAQLDFLDREQARVTATSKSAAETETIQRQFDQKRRDAEKKASEEKKSIALKELAINYAVGVIKSLAQYGLPLALIPIAAMTLAYFLQKGTIEHQQFGKGGRYGGGGLLDGPSHSEKGGMPVIHPGTGQVQAYLEGNEGIINKKSMGDRNEYSVSGTPAQIASTINQVGGGVSFAPGGMITYMARGGMFSGEAVKYSGGGTMGTDLRAPVFNNGYYSSNVNANNIVSNDMEDLKQMVRDVTAAVHASDTKEVQLNHKNVTKAQNRTRRDVSVGTI